MEEQKRTMEKRDYMKEGLCIRHALPLRVLRVQGSLFLDYKINTEHYKLIFLPEKIAKSF